LEGLLPFTFKFITSGKSPPFSFPFPQRQFSSRCEKIAAGPLTREVENRWEPRFSSWSSLHVFGSPLPPSVEGRREGHPHRLAKRQLFFFSIVYFSPFPSQVYWHAVPPFSIISTGGTHFLRSNGPLFPALPISVDAIRPCTGVSINTPFSRAR